MARLIACPRCQNRMDVGALSPGSSVTCPDCGQVARIPTGNTSVRTKAAAPPPAANPSKGNTALRVAAAQAPPPAAPGAAERPTRVRQRPAGRLQPRPRTSNAPLFVGIAVGAIGITVALVVLMSPPSAPPKPLHAPAAATVPDPSPPPRVPLPDPGSAAAPPSDAPAPAPVRRDPQKANWDQLMQTLRPGGGFDDPGRPEGVAFQMVKDMGKAAYPHLVRYIDHEDAMIGRAAVTVLGELSGRKGQLPNEATKAKIRSEWESWLKENP
jgi:hypothetical protein